MDLYDFMKLNFIHFPVELLICEVIFLIKKPRREHFAVRLVISFILYFLISAGWMTWIDSFGTDSLLPQVFLYLGYALYTAVPIYICFEIYTLELLFSIAGGYATQHMCFALLRIFLYLTQHSLEVSGMNRIFTQYIFYIIWAVMIYMIIIRRNQRKDEVESSDVRIVILALIVALTAIVLSVFYTNPTDASLNMYNCVLCPIYGLVCCMLILMMEYYVLRENRMKREHEIMEQLLQMANSQQKSSKEAIDIINMKCHDLKHQLKAFSSMSESEERMDYVKEVQQAVSIYDAIFHTGSEELDYVLREKSLMFNEYHIAFSCMANGSLLYFMTSADIYALMGNALDNALECEIQEKENERSVSLHINQHHDMILIHLENRCSVRPRFEADLPLTNKTDQNQHGFGVRSMRYIAEKYNGSIQMTVRDEKFLLDILLPKPQN